MSLRHLRLAVLAVSLGFTFVSPWAHAATASAAPTLPAGVTQGPSAEGISEYRFANGFKLLLLPDDSKPTVTVNITYLVGSRHENYGETGMAHLRASADVVFLDIPLALVRERIGDYGSRGIARRPDQSLDDLFEERQSLYLKHADIVIRGEGLAQDALCLAVASAVRAHRRR